MKKSITEWGDNWIDVNNHPPQPDVEVFVMLEDKQGNEFIRILKLKKEFVQNEWVKDKKAPSLEGKPLYWKPSN